MGKKSVWEEDENDLKKSALYIHTFFFSPRLSGYLLVSFPWWCEFHFTVRFVLLCYVPGWATLSLSFFFPPFCFRSRRVERHSGSVWKLEVMPPNPLPALEYTVWSHIQSHTHAATQHVHAQRRVQTSTHTHTHTRAKQKGLVPALTHPGRTNSNKRIKRTNMHAQIATRTIWLRKEAVDLDALWLENQNTFTEY